MCEVKRGLFGILNMLWFGIMTEIGAAPVPALGLKLEEETVLLFILARLVIG